MTERTIRRPNFYAESGLDRVSHLREDASWLAARLADPRSRLVPVWRAHNLFRPPNPQSERPEPILPTVGEHGAVIENGRPVVLLGLVEEVAYFAVDVSHHEDAAAASTLFGGGEFADLRRYGLLIEHRAGGILAYARGILHWHGRHRFCGVCGAPTESAEAGHVRVCTNPACGAHHFPRTDPAVIMLVSHGDRCLLGRQKVWPPGMHSTLAGFVEPGESLEDAVAREVFEEAGLRVRDVRYHSSQPWPFPASIMLGFHAEAATTEIDVNGSELEAARWFSREALLASPEDDTFRLPRRDSIARRLVESWLGRG